MAGHSKWANIRHRKGKADQQKGKIFSRLSKEIISAVKQGGSDPKSNSRLRLAISRAKAGNLPNDNIERLIRRGASQDQASYELVLYEIYGYGGVGILVEMMTDNKNRSASDIRTVLGKRGGTLATPGSVSFNFDERGLIMVVATDEQQLMQWAIEVGALDFEVSQEGSCLITEPLQLYAVKERLEGLAVTVEEADRGWLAKHSVSCNQEDREANEALIEALEAIEDAQAVYHNMESSL